HPDVFNILLQMFDDGHLTDAKGHKVDFRNTIVVMTSNIGSDLIRKGSFMGFAKPGEEDKNSEESYNRMKGQVLDEVKKFFRPEFLNRIDASVVFHPLNEGHILQIVDLMLRDVAKQLLEKGVSMEVSQAAKELLAEKGFDPNFGARPLRRVIQERVEDRLSEDFLAGKFGPGDTVHIDVDGGGEIVARVEVPVAPV
ncbi:MAG: AAA family ATPase, partial [Dehalococcoidia bacterium]|nr:AAA family ATPase [Dehalococcoidia bacterium]